MGNTPLDRKNELLDANEKLRSAIFDYTDGKPDSARKFLKYMKKVSRLTYEAMLERMRERNNERREQAL